MEKTVESVAEEIASLRRVLTEVTAAVDSYDYIATRNVKDQTAAGLAEISESRKALFLQASGLLRTVRGPVDMAISHLETSVYSGCVRTLLEMGVFEAVPIDGSSITASALSKTLGVEKELLVRLMRNATVNGPFAEVGFEEYAHTPYSQIYAFPAIKSFFQSMYSIPPNSLVFNNSKLIASRFDEFVPVNAKLYEFFRENGFKTPESETINPYSYTHRTGNKSMWEYLNQYPERLSALNAAMLANSESNPWTVELFPFESELLRVETNEDTVLLIDIGGGRGHVTKQIRTLTSRIPGRLILQERPEVLADITEHLRGIETMEYDFFTPQPIQGALIYYIRHCLHDWSDKDCVRILKQIAGAMKIGTSRLVISESILPESGVDLESAWMDVTMMAVSGVERTESQWVKILDESGFKLHQTYRSRGTNFAAIEAYLK